MARNHAGSWIGARTVLLAVLGVLGAHGRALAQTGGPYDLSWNTFDGGGALSLYGGPYLLSGTTGQADAGQLAGGSYGLHGGFWYRSIALLDVDPPPAGGAPERFRVLAPSPNPFRTSTVFAFDLPREGRVRIDVFSVSGQRVRQLLDDVRPAGRHQAWWDGRDDRGNALGQGIYFMRVSAADDHGVRKVIRAD